METNETAFENAVMRKRRQKRRRTVLSVALSVLALLGCVLLYRALGPQEEESAGVRSYLVGQVIEGEINSTVSGSGQLAAKQEASFTAPAESRVTAVYKKPGEAVTAGETVLTLTSESVEAELESLYDELDSLRTTLATMRQVRSSKYVTAPYSGVVKDVRAAANDNAEDHAYLCLISTDGRMQAVFETGAAVRLHDTLEVLVEGTERTGKVTAVDGTRVSAVIETNAYPIGTAVSVNAADGTPLGTGELVLNEYVTVVCEDGGRILAVYAAEGKRVSRGTSLFRLDEDTPYAAYLTRRQEEADLLEQIGDMEDSLNIKAEWDGVVTEISAGTGDTVAADAALCRLMSRTGYTLSLSVDELDVFDVSLGQTAAVTLDAVEGTWSGAVSNISYVGSTGGNVTTFPVTVSLDYIEGAYPGSSASAQIVTDTSGQTTVVPVAAVQYEQGNAFVYVADEGASRGMTYAENELDLAALRKESVTTGMSDGTYIAVSGELTAGTLILVPQLTTTATYTGTSASDNTAFSMRMGDTQGMGSPPDASWRSDDASGNRRPGSGN